MNDDKLTLYYYNDGLTADERQQICSSLAADRELADRYHHLSNELSALKNEEPQTLANDRLQRFHDVIDRAARRDYGRGRVRDTKVHFWSFFWGAAATAALAAAIGIGIRFTDTGSPGLPESHVVDVHELPAGGTTPAALNRSMQVHFRDSRAELARLPLESQSDRLLLVMQMIEQNRLHERIAVQNNAPNLARVLRAFEPILMRLAEDDIAPEDAKALRAQLAFELNAMLTKLAQSPSDESHST